MAGVRNCGGLGACFHRGAQEPTDVDVLGARKLPTGQWRGPFDAGGALRARRRGANAEKTQGKERWQRERSFRRDTERRRNPRRKPKARGPRGAHGGESAWTRRRGGAEIGERRTGSKDLTRRLPLGPGGAERRERVTELSSPRFSLRLRASASVFSRWQGAPLRAQGVPPASGFSLRTGSCANAAEGRGCVDGGRCG